LALGAGRWRGGDGVVREIEMLTDAHVTILSDRRKTRPYGLGKEQPGAAGRNTLIGRSGQRRLAAKDSIHARAGDLIRIETPGGGHGGVKTE
jgi:N-methylhydantoinase B